MRITRVKTFIVDGAFRPWTFVKIETSDDGLVGWGDCTDWGSPRKLAVSSSEMNTSGRWASVSTPSIVSWSVIVTKSIPRRLASS